MAGGVAVGRIGVCAAGGSVLPVASFAASAFAISAGEGSASPANCSSSLPLIASRMKSIQIGSATLAPCIFSPSDCRLSNPTQTPQVTEGENPRNHASVKSLVVPVLPPIGCFNCAAEAPVPDRVTCFSNCIIVRAVAWLVTSFTSGACSHNVIPSAFETFFSSRGATRMPSLGKTE